MNTVRRVIGVLVVGISCALFVAGCGSGAGGPGTEVKKSEGEMKDFTKQRMEEMQKAKAAMKECLHGEGRP